MTQNATSIRALHNPGKNNDAADILSRGGPHANNWSLCPTIIQSIWARFGTAQVDLFAAKANHKCPLWFSMRPSDKAPLGLNALGQTRWPRVLLYAYPPYSLLVVRGRERTDDPGGPVRTQRELVPENVAMGRGRTVGDPRSTRCPLPSQQPTDRAPHNQGRPVSGLDAHKAMRLAQGFDEPSVEVMLHARKSSTNATYN